MKKQILSLLIAILSFNCYSQISFEKGYYIDNTNQKTNCLIKNIDWGNNPTQFEYKLSKKSESKNVTIKTVIEFGIDNVSKYIRKKVLIDRSSNNINKLSSSKKPILKEEELFLKVLVEGKSNLYEYVEGNLRKYFYSKDNSDITQLIFKRYNNAENKITINNRFRQQLWINLKCSNFKMSKIESVNYRKNDLIRFFTEYNECHNSDLSIYEQKRNLYNLTIRPRLNSSSLNIQSSLPFISDIDFENKTGVGIGLEAELFFASNKNKWSLAIEPTYQNYKSKKTTIINNASEGQLISEVNYNSIEIPLSLRHYFFLNKNSKIFLNVSFIFDSSLNSSIEFSGDTSSAAGISSFEMKSQSNFGMGIGYKQNDRYSLEMRFQTNRQTLSDFVYWSSDYKTLSIIFGYSLFQKTTHNNSYK